MYLAIYNGFQILYGFTFKPYFSQTDWFIIFSLFIDFVFVVDLILGFFTTFMANKVENALDHNSYSTIIHKKGFLY
jgi:hypothetical protein